MDKPERDGHIDHFRKQVLPVAVLVLKDKVDEVRNKDFEEFKKAMIPIAEDALEGLIFDRGLPDRQMLDADLLDRIFFLMAANFNEALPLDYPYAFCIGRTPSS